MSYRLENDPLIDPELVGGPVQPCPSGDPDCVVLGGGVVCPHGWTIPQGATTPVRISRQPSMYPHWFIAAMTTVTLFAISPWVDTRYLPWILTVTLVAGLWFTRRERRRGR